jgi:hypothetical protein
MRFDCRSQETLLYRRSFHEIFSADSSDTSSPIKRFGLRPADALLGVYVGYGVMGPFANGMLPAPPVGGSSWYHSFSSGAAFGASMDYAFSDMLMLQTRIGIQFPNVRYLSLTGTTPRRTAGIPDTTYNLAASITALTIEPAVMLRVLPRLWLVGGAVVRVPFASATSQSTEIDEHYQRRVIANNERGTLPRYNVQFSPFVGIDGVLPLNINLDGFSRVLLIPYGRFYFGPTEQSFFYRSPIQQVQMGVSVKYRLL